METRVKLERGGEGIKGIVPILEQKVGPVSQCSYPLHSRSTHKHLLHASILSRQGLGVVNACLSTTAKWHFVGQSLSNYPGLYSDQLLWVSRDRSSSQIAGYLLAHSSKPLLKTPQHRDSVGGLENAAICMCVHSNQHHRPLATSLCHMELSNTLLRCSHVEGLLILQRTCRC